MKEICYAYVLTNLSWHVNIFRKYSYTLCLKKNAPTLASCSFDSRGLILIIFGQQHLHTFNNDMHS